MLVLLFAGSVCWSVYTIDELMKLFSVCLVIYVFDLWRNVVNCLESVHECP